MINRSESSYWAGQEHHLTPTLCSFIWRRMLSDHCKPLPWLPLCPCLTPEKHRDPTLYREASRKGYHHTQITLTTHSPALPHSQTQLQHLGTCQLHRTQTWPMCYRQWWPRCTHHAHSHTRTNKRSTLITACSPDRGSTLSNLVGTPRTGPGPSYFIPPSYLFLYVVQLWPLPTPSPPPEGHSHTSPHIPLLLA